MQVQVTGFVGKGLACHIGTSMYRARGLQATLSFWWAIRIVSSPAAPGAVVTRIVHRCLLMVAWWRARLLLLLQA